MAIIGKSGELLSYDSSELIEDLELDIIEYGGHLIVDAVVKKINGIYFFVDFKWKVTNSPSYLSIRDVAITVRPT